MPPVKCIMFTQCLDRMRWMQRRPLTFSEEIESLNAIGRKAFAPLRGEEPSPEQWKEALLQFRQFNEEAAALRKAHYGSEAQQPAPPTTAPASQ